MSAQEVSFESIGRAGIQPFSTGQGLIAVAVSGGSDSLALLAWADKYARESDHSLLVLTVNHRLRPGSEADAVWVANVAKALGHRARVLEWLEPIGQQEAARQARHKLLAKAAKAEGACTLLLGHTFDDVVETVLIRHRRNRRAKRLAGPVFVSASPVWPAGRNLILCRPLLWQRRAHLRSELRRKGWVWRDDPSNVSPKYERNRVRTFLDRHSMMKARLADTVEKALHERHQFDAATAQLLRSDSSVRIDADGLIRASWDGTHSDTVRAAIGLLIRVASGSDQAARARSLSTALAQLERRGDRTTLAGTWLQRTRSGILIGQDPGEIASLSEQGIWDGRFEADTEARMPAKPHHLVRASMPPSSLWREIVSERLSFETDLMLKLGDEAGCFERFKTPISLTPAPLPTHLQRSEAQVSDS